jgi:hypothetical protein
VVVQANEEKRHSVVERTTYCHVCDRRIGDSILVVQPDGACVHFKCFRGDAVDAPPSTAGAGSAAMRRY